MFGKSIELVRLAPRASREVAAPGESVVLVALEGSFEVDHFLRLEAGDFASCPLDAGSSARALDHQSAVFLHAIFRGAQRPARPELLRRERAEPGLQEVARLIHRELSQNPQSAVAHTLLDPLWAYFSRSLGSDWRSPGDPRIARAYAELLARPAHAWTVEALAKIAGLSRAAFARRFAEEHGASPMKLVFEHRMALAARLLVEGEKSLAEIAAEIGYESEFAFSRAFKREHGEAPALFRRRMRLADPSIRTDTIRAAA